MNTPTLINLPPPPSDPVTPSDVPGTPNSGTTSMSELSTVAIKDGHRGHPHHHSHRPQASTLDTTAAERADRISRLAGLERVATVRQASAAGSQSGALAAAGQQQQSQPPQLQPHQGYFDPAAAPGGAAHKERSTVGSASATGSVGGRTTWASGSNAEDTTDKMSEDPDDMDTSSAGGFSDEGNASLVGFGEGASSTASGPVSSTPGRAPHRLSRGNGMATPQSRDAAGVQPMLGVSSTAAARSMDSMTMDHDGGGGVEAAEQIMRDRSFTAGNSDGGIQQQQQQQQQPHDGQQSLGKFNFE